MDYKNIHDGIIRRAECRETPSGYIERHHIIPKSMGGTDSGGNIVALTAREHYVIHWLLYKIHKNNPMAFAWHAMSMDKSGVRIRSAGYEYAKREWSKRISILNTGTKRSAETRAKISAAHLGQKAWNKGLSLPSKERIEYELNPKKCLCCDSAIAFNGRGARKYCSVKCQHEDWAAWNVDNGNFVCTKPNKTSFKKGHQASDAVIKKISEALTGYKRPKGACPHCGKEGALSLLKRWHFDNCKQVAA